MPSSAQSDEGGARWATLCSLIETAKMNSIEPYAHLRDVLERMIDGYPVNRLDELLPWNWQPAESVKNLRPCARPRRLPPLVIGAICCDYCDGRARQSLRSARR
jgi:hypothetical protein